MHSMACQFEQIMWAGQSEIPRLGTPKVGRCGCRCVVLLPRMFVITGADAGFWRGGGPT